MTRQTPTAASTRSCRPWRRSLAAASAVTLALALGACGDDEDTGAPASADKPAQATTAVYPVTIENCGETLTFEQAPSRAVLPYHPIAETFVGLGLGDRATGRVDYVVEKRSDPATLPEQTGAFERIPIVSKTIFPPPKEEMLALRPDFLLAYGDFDYGGKHEGAEGLANRAQLRKAGAEIYTVACPDESEKTSGERLEATYRSILDLGRIFGVSERAQQRVADMKAQIADVKRRVAGRPPVPVIVYSDGEGPVNLNGGSNIVNDLVEAAGGKNLFADEDPYFEASLESVAAEKPEAFVIFADPPEQEVGAKAARFLFEKFPNMTASKNRRFALTSCLYTPPGWRNAQTVEDIARQLHPDAFDQPSETMQFTDGKAPEKAR